MWYGWRFWWAIVWMPVFSLGIAALFVCSFVGYLCWENSCLKTALHTKHSLVISAHEEVVAVKGALIATQNKARKDFIKAYHWGLHEATPNIVLPNMVEKDIRKSAFLILEIRDLGTDESGMAYSTTTLRNAQGALVTYSFMVNERNLDPVSKLMFNMGRIAVEKNK